MIYSIVEAASGAGDHSTPICLCKSIKKCIFFKIFLQKRIVLTFKMSFQVNKALQYVSEDSKDKAYQAWLGYYNSCGMLKWDKPTLVKRANMFSATLGLEQPPALMKKTIGMMGLRNVPGLRIA